MSESKAENKKKEGKTEIVSRSSALNLSIPKSRLLAFFSFVFVSITLCVAPLAAQKIAVLTPDKSADSQNFRENLESTLSKNFQILDDALAESVAQNLNEQNFFNLSTEDAQNFGQALGSQFFICAKSETLRRSTEEKPKFYIESYAVVYLISARTGRLIFWKLESFQSQTDAESKKKLTDSLPSLAREISLAVKQNLEKESSENSSAKLEELPEENSPDAKNFRSPLPYRRLKPEYTKAANLYGVTATVDAAVELDAAGTVKKVEITRWAGYGLDEAVEATIRKMQWRAAERNGKPLPIRVLLRYNFKKTDRDN